MDMTSFHKLRTAVQENANPADGIHATDLRDSLHAALTGSGLFDEIEFGQTEDPTQMVIGVCRCADGVLPWEAGMGLERLWQVVAADVQWEAHVVGCTDTLMEFEAAVTVDDSGHYVTLHVVAEPSQAIKDAIAAQAEVVVDESAPVGAVSEPSLG
jgi:hypothetical protein